MPKCNFCGVSIERGTGKMYVFASGKVNNFCTNRCEKNLLKLKRKPLKVRWTEFYRKEHGKESVEKKSDEEKKTVEKKDDVKKEKQPAVEKKEQPQKKNTEDKKTEKKKIESDKKPKEAEEKKPGKEDKK